MTRRCGSKLSWRLSVQVFPRYAGLDAWDLGGTPSPCSGNSWWRSGADASTPPSQTLTPSPTATTLRGRLQRRWGYGHHGRHGGRRRRCSSPRSRGRSQDTWERRAGRPTTSRRQGCATCVATRIEGQARRGPRAPQPARASPRVRPTEPAQRGARADVLETCTNRSLGMKSLSRSSAVSLKPVKTLWRQPCYYATCPNPQTPRHDAFEMRCKVCSTWQQHNKQKVRPLDA